jgi:uncharacterized protein YyaL (SSP411 family)
MHVNRLIREKSPYLLQHAHNPVDWYAWGEEAFEKARAEDKPIFLSVGYSTCHWCHVMERESFEDEAVAAVLNREFVPVKVDREERPDVDRIYMTFVQATTGSGGWPMSVWLTPELKPFYGGTYFPPDSRYGRPGFRAVLEQIAQAWKTQRAKLVESSAAILDQIESATRVEAGEAVTAGAPEAACQYFRRTFDPRWGGFGGAPKFPRPAVLSFLFRYHHVTGEAEALEMALKTLREMAKGGMKDHLGGGFHRYSVDEQWFVPHFEKMLYDQAQLAIAYLEAFQVTSEESYARVAEEIFEYVLRDMTHEQGGFFSAEDADSALDAAKPQEKGEGAFYVWRYAELVEVLGVELAARFARCYGCGENGNVEHDPHGEFSGRNILFEADAPHRAMDECRQRLFEARLKRPRPHLDDKILASWNGLMISALARGAQVLDEVRPASAARYLAAAQRGARFVLTRLFDSGTGTLYRRWREGERAVEGVLDDYASMAQALIDLHEATFDRDHLELALRLARRAIELFEDSGDGGFYSSPAGKSDLVLRLKEDYDGAEPAGNSVMAHVLLRLSQLTGHAELAESAARVFRAFGSRLSAPGAALPSMLAAWIFQTSPKQRVVLSGDPEGAEWRALLAETRRAFRPHMIVVRGEPGGRAAAQVCENETCLLPVSEAAELAKLLH